MVTGSDIHAGDNTRDNIHFAVLNLVLVYSFVCSANLGVRRLTGNLDCAGHNLGIVLAFSQEMDADGNGLISRQEFHETLKDERVTRRKAKSTMIQ